MDTTFIKTSLTGAQIAYIRNRLGLSQAAFAKLLGFSQPKLSRRETNHSPQTGSEIVVITLVAKEEQIKILPHDEAVAFLARSTSITSDGMAA